MLEVTARAITYYLDVSAECTRRIVAVDGAIKAMCNRLVVADVTNRTSRDLAEQCIKVHTSHIQSGLEYRTRSEFGWSKPVLKLNSSVFEDHPKSEQFGFRKLQNRPFYT